MRTAHVSPASAAAALVISSALSGCYLASDGQARERKLTALQARQTELTTTLDSERERLTQLILRAEQEITRLQGVLTEAEAALRRNNADLAVRADQQDRDIAALRGQVEEARHQVETLRQELELVRQDLAAQIGALAAPAPASPAPRR
jgi:predicted RNase H-like nuclease (RuvC/YqgF family)